MTIRQDPDVETSLTFATIKVEAINEKYQSWSSTVMECVQIPEIISEKAMWVKEKCYPCFNLNTNATYIIAVIEKGILLQQ